MAKSGKQTSTGKGFEYACALVLQDYYSTHTTVRLRNSPQLNTARAAFLGLSEKEQTEDLLGAEAAIKIINKLEPMLAQKETMEITLQTDSQGINGDVRDVLCLRSSDWEIGLSCKHNHEAVKHSRLSDQIDFGQVWFGIPCSLDYMETVKKLFAPLRQLRDESKAAGEPALWQNYLEGKNELYNSVLTAFIKELTRLDAANPGKIPELLVRYLIGKNDFYKVIMKNDRRYTQVEAVNINGTLNQADGKTRALLDVPRLPMPTKFYEIGFKENSNNTIVVICNNGWNFTMRIHNASSKIEPSLKLDVQLEALPNAMMTQVQEWGYLDFDVDSIRPKKFVAAEKI